MLENLDKLREWLQREHDRSAENAKATRGSGQSMHLAYLEGHRDGLDYALRALCQTRTELRKKASSILSRDSDS